MRPSDPFAALIDPVSVLSACARSGALDALPVSAARSADRASAKVPAELAKHDAAVDELDQQLVAKAAKTSSAKKTVRAREACAQ